MTMRGLSALLLLLLGWLVACDDEQAAPAATSPTPPSAEAWRLKGRVTPDQTTWPDAPPFEGGRALVQKCGALRPCAAERWQNEAGASMDMVRVRDEFHHTDGTVWPGRWWSISGVLRACLGDPMSVPPTRDPGAFRSLVIDNKGPRWVIRLSGDNRCGLEGLVILNAKADRLDLDQLTCDGKPWKKGGRKCAKANLAKAAPTPSE